MKAKITFYTALLMGVVIFFTGCADSDNVTGAGNGNIDFEVYSPAANDSISFNGHEVTYALIPSSGVNFIELLIDGVHHENFYPGLYAYPIVTIKLDSSYIGKTISYKLIYFDQDGSSKESKTVNDVIVTEDRTPPHKPYNIKLVKLSETSINLAWKDSSTNNVGYEIWRQTGYNGQFEPHLVVSPGNYNVNDENLDPNIIYFYMVRGKNKYGTSDFTEIVNTLGVGGSLTVPAPTNLTAEAVDTKVILLSWQDNSNNENFFKIERRLSFTDFEPVGFAGRNETTFRDSGTGLFPGTEYYYRVKAISSSDSSWSNEVYIKTPNYILKAPTILSLNQLTSNSVEINWRDNDGTFANFIIERKIEAAGTYSEITEAAGYLTTFSDNSVEPGHTYYYRIKCSDGVQESNYSNEMSITTQIIP